MSRQLWEREYLNPAISSSTNRQPSHGTAFLRGCLPRIARVRGPRRLLDLGCGGGRNAGVLTETGLAYHGMDFAYRPLAKAAARDTDGSLRLVQGSMADRLPFADGAFSLVTAFTSVENVVEDRQLRTLAEEARRVLCPGGLLYVYFLTTEDDYYRPLVDLGPDGRSLTYDPVTGLRQRVYRLSELSALFHPSFALLDSEEFVFRDTRSNGTYLRRLAAGLWASG
ncbi:class I SAM-dependent methyltransferase [Streptomyces yaizuensis]|uniref:Class I SAM-dependent methyltransferase n=1 Tax=Streptomyces yaizuensis TaxID=2989713 RepID=A0ABQ5NRA3_9ACTN|nr:class I SAM-dependent methyltransferase [Streptomyces sp. YSPA8]GLF92908.1 class I SAM-dependent methyltransferase [Streptomyces sp. YSPA8]